MAFSTGDFFDGGLKCAHGFFPHLVKVGAQAGNSFRVQLVEATGSGLRICNQARILQHAQVLGYCRAAYGEGFGEFIDGDGTAGELLEDGHSGGIAEGIESGL